ncbi:MAG: hypothetical protein WC315_03755 [Candidatus Omnitrophota bacterium]|jgi:hypothetical protein
MARCEFTYSNGQCSEEALEGEKYCSLHTHVDPEKHQKRLYNLLKYKYRTRYEQIGEHEALRSLRDEVAISKMMLEETLNSIQNDSEFIASRADLAQQLATVEKLVASMIKMETSLGSLLAKPTLLKIAGEIVQILLEKLKDVPNHEVLIDEISAAILKTIGNVKENVD